MLSVVALSLSVWIATPQQHHDKLLRAVVIKHRADLLMKQLDVVRVKNEDSRKETNAVIARAQGRMRIIEQKRAWEAEVEAKKAKEEAEAKQAEAQRRVKFRL